MPTRSKTSSAQNNPAANTSDLANAYAENVVAGRIIAGKYVRLACRRHLDDLANGHKRGLTWSPFHADHAGDFWQFLRHSKGEWKGQSFTLEPWQAFIVASIFGWLGPDGFRRFTNAYISVARKNGKTTLSAGVGLYLFIGDGEPGAEVYSAATKRDQALISHREATRMVRASPLLRRHVAIHKNNLSIPGTASLFAPLGSDRNTDDGLNVHGAIIDELHAHRTAGTLDVLESAIEARRQPLIFVITTAGFNTAGVCYELDGYCRRILEARAAGKELDDTHFAYIARLDIEFLRPSKPEAQDDDAHADAAATSSSPAPSIRLAGDDWKNPAVWIKANPNLGVSVKPQRLAAKARKAEKLPRKLNEFLRRHANVWTQADVGWLPMQAWHSAGAEPFDLETLRGRPVTSGLDLANVTDLAAFALCFYPRPKDPPETPYAFAWRIWCPEATVDRRTHDEGIDYSSWVRQGHLIATPGDSIDHGAIKAQILADAEAFGLHEFAYDRFGADALIQDLRDAGLEPIPIGQGTQSMSPAMKDFERLLLAGRIRHPGNPVADWSAGNVVAATSHAGIRPDRKASKDKIDPIVAALMAFRRAILIFQDRKISPYSTRKTGIRAL